MFSPLLAKPKTCHHCCRFLASLPRRPKQETLQRRSQERKAAKHGARGTRGAKRLELAGGGRGGGGRGAAPKGGSSSSSRGPAGGQQQRRAAKPKRAFAKFK